MTLTFIAILAFSVAEDPARTESVVMALGGIDFKNDSDGYVTLMKLGERAFPAYESILSDMKSDPTVVGRAFGVISGLKTDRHRFLNVTVVRLGDSDEGVRYGALVLLREIGTEQETAPVVALLSDPDLMVRTAAAETLVIVGGKRDLLAMDIWLRIGVSPRNDKDHLLHVKKCRDKLAKRLKEQPVPKGLKN